MYTQKKTYFVNPFIPSTDLKCLTACLRTCPFKPPRNENLNESKNPKTKTINKQVIALTRHM